MKFKSLLTRLASLLLVLSVVVSCDDSSSSDPVLPSVTLSSDLSNVNLVVGESIDITFDVSTAEGYSSSNVSATNGSASVSSEPSAGASSGQVVIEFTASTAGAATIQLTVTDQEGQTDDATGAVSVVEEETTIRIVDNITEDTTWETGKIYVLGGRIAVEAGVTLTIQEGVIVKGEAGTGQNASALLIARDAILNANGTANNPIIFTSVADEILPDGFGKASPNLTPDISGLWGGLIILGNAPISASTVPIQIEGIPTSDENGLYGGDDPNDSSGTIQYISIRHGGSNIGEGNEINGLTLGGVGSGTVIENVEIVANQDDGVEWFGGNVDVDGILVWNSGDDGLDTDQDWFGTASNFIILTPVGGSAFELDGPEGDLNRGCHSFMNGIIYAGDDIDHLVDWDDNTNAGLTDLYFYGIDPGYMASDDFSPVESFGGDGNCQSGNWEYTLPDDGASADQVFTGVPEAALTEVAANANTNGPDISRFSWTWASISGALSSIGLE